MIVRFSLVVELGVFSLLDEHSKKMTGTTRGRNDSSESRIDIRVRQIKRHRTIKHSRKIIFNIEATSATTPSTHESRRNIYQL